MTQHLKRLFFGLSVIAVVLTIGLVVQLIGQAVESAPEQVRATLFIGGGILVVAYLIGSVFDSE